MLIFGCLSPQKSRYYSPFLQIEGFRLDYIQLFLKRSSIISMSFLFYINNGFTTVATLQQVQGYYQNIGPFYTSNQQSFPSANFIKTWTQCDGYSQCETFAPTVLYTTAQEQKQKVSKDIITQIKPKRRPQKTLEKEILSAKKNSESNIINQFYSLFGNREKSQKLVQKCAVLLGKVGEQVEKAVGAFYLSIRLINAKRGRKYVNAAMLLRFFTAQQMGEYLGELRQKIEELGLSLDELSQIFRRCTRIFLKDIAVSAILTSKRISPVSKKEHLNKLRRLLRAIMAN